MCGAAATRVCACRAGGPFFNLFNLGKTEAALNELKLKEIKNGRLAMLAMWGYGAQVRRRRWGEARGRSEQQLWGLCDAPLADNAPPRVLALTRSLAGDADGQGSV